jgi:hypothetical protein
MKPPPSGIRKALYPPGEQAAWWIPLGAGVGAWAVIYLSGINRNALYLSMLGSAYFILSLLTRRWWSSGLVFGACAYLACFPAEIPQVQFIEPNPHGPSDSPELSEVGRDAQWSYRFVLSDMGKDQAAGGLKGFLNIDGVALEDLKIEVQGRLLQDLPPTSIKYWREHLSIPVECGNAGEVVVTLRAGSSPYPRIFCGPEVHGLGIYSDAVWLEFANEQTSVLYHAKRLSRPLSER